MKYLLIGLAMIGTIVPTFGQTQPAKEWTLYKEMSGIEIYAKLTDCSKNAGFDRKQILLKLINTTEFSSNVHYHVDSYFNNACKTCVDPDGEYSIDIQLKPNSVVEADCGTMLKGLTVFAGWNEQGVQDANFSGFELTDVQVMFGSKDGHVEPAKEVLSPKSSSYSDMTIEELKTSISEMEDKLKMVKADEKLNQEALDHGWFALANEELELANAELKLKRNIPLVKTEIKRSDLESWPEDKQKYVDDHPELYIITEQ